MKDSDLKMHQNAAPILYDRARKLRLSATEAEKLLWEEIKGKKIGPKFRRQHPLGNYIADFYCHEIKAVSKCPEIDLK